MRVVYKRKICTPLCVLKLSTTYPLSNDSTARINEYKMCNQSHLLQNNIISNIEKVKTVFLYL